MSGVKSHIIQKINALLPYTPNEQQQELISDLADFVQDRQEGVYVLRGYAGTGKTSTVSALVKQMQQAKQQVILLAPTGRAAKVLAAYANYPAYTIHKKIYRQKNSKDGFGAFELDYNRHRYALFIVDEASMLTNQSNGKSLFGSGRLLDDLIDYVFVSGTGCRLLLIGDTAQLPPVGTSLSPALDHREMEAYNLKTSHITLTQVVRQAEDSGILYNATTIRQLIADNVNQLYQQELPYPRLKLEGFPDVERINGEDLIDCIGQAYQEYGIEQSIIICRTNKRANRFNQGIRNQILFRDSQIATEDMLMVVKNNYFWLAEYEEIDFIANGDIAEITRIKSYKELYGFHFAEVELRLTDHSDCLIDVCILLDALSAESPALSQDDNQKLFYAVAEDYQEINNKRKRYKKVRENIYFNALQVKFAYAITCHKAQGGQWPVVFIDQGYLTKEMITTDYLRWLYTAFTRASKKVYLINFDSRFFEE